MQNIVVLTGAGISTESGIKTFRASDGLWENHRIEDVATPEAFARDPKLVNDFYNQRRSPIARQAVHPNTAHCALAELEKHTTGDFTLITQNIDNLHERAGSKNIIHMHGDILSMRCIHTQQVFPCDKDILPDLACACCDEVGSLRPNIVWFGEMPMLMETIYQQLAQCDVFLCIGTSGNVYPAAGFVELAKQAEAQTIEFNLESSNISAHFSQHIEGKATETVPDFVHSYLLSA